jgi:hypothetical protein
MTSVQERVATGSALLDARVPGWAHRINNATLNIASGCNCILGQLYGAYGTGLNDLKINSPMLHGFALNWSGEDETEDVNEAWREVVAQRRMATAPVEVLA